ncbi:MAG: hypothetical protein U1C59_14530, partial [Methylotenera sp.]|nr:hypothetical protein [Methylotenera sp.]
MADIYALSETERRVFLEQLAIRLIRGENITQDEKEWLGYGLMAMACGDKFNQAFRVKNIKSANAQTHAVRYALVERKRAEGLIREKAIAEVAAMQSKDCETIDASHD